jgi:hypothetical protein
MTMGRPATKKIEKPEPKPALTDEQPRVLSSDEQSIAQRVAAADREWELFNEDSVIDFSLADDPLKLPEPALKMEKEKKFKFRWIERKPARLDTMRNLRVPMKWWPCNSTNTPFLDGFFDPILGCVSRLDQMLVFKPWIMWTKEREIKDQMAGAVDSGTILSKQGEAKGGMDFIASRRNPERVLDTPRQEISGTDVVLHDEALIDKRNGVSHDNSDMSELVTD